MTVLATNESLTLSQIVAARIRGLRAELTWNQAELGRAAGLSRANITDRESGRKAVNVDELPALASALGTSVAYLMGLTNDRSRPLEEAASGALRACRDSNPKPSDLSTATGRARRAWGMLVEREIGIDEPDLSASVIRFPIERRSA